MAAGYLCADRRFCTPPRVPGFRRRARLRRGRPAQSHSSTGQLRLAFAWATERIFATARSPAPVSFSTDSQTVTVRRTAASQNRHDRLIGGCVATRSHPKLLRRSDGMEDLIGYARVSTDEQNLALQLDALKQAGLPSECSSDVGSGSLQAPSRARSPAFEFLVAGDTLVVWRLDRLGRGLKHLIDAIEQLHEPRDRLSLTDRADRHDHQRRDAAVPHLRRAGRVRAPDHPGAHPRRPGRRSRSRTARQAARRF